MRVCAHVCMCVGVYVCVQVFLTYYIEVAAYPTTEIVIVSRTTTPPTLVDTAMMTIHVT